MIYRMKRKKAFRYLLASFSFVFFFSFICEVIIIKYFNYQDDILISKSLKLINKVFIAVMTKSSFKNEIIYYKNLLFKEFLKQPYADNILFFGDDPIVFPEKDFPYVPVNPNGDLSRHFLCSKLKAALQHFLFQTDAAWFVRVCGDTYINMRTFPQFLLELNQSFNPFKDTVIQGACLGKEGLVYIQGGSGFVFSRKAAFDLYNDWAWMDERCVEFSNDDRILSNYIQKINISFYDATSRWFLGHRFFKYSSAYDAVLNAHDLNNCFYPVSKKGCKPFFTKVKDITFWHDQTNFSTFIGKIDDIMNKATDDLYFFVPNNKPMLCRAPPNVKDGYYD